MVAFLAGLAGGLGGAGAGAGLAGSAAGSVGGGLLGWGLGEASAGMAFDRQKKVLQNQFRWRVRDIERAGYNPLLAFGGGGGVGGGGSAPMGASRDLDLPGKGLKQQQQRLAQQQQNTARAQESVGLATAEKEMWNARSVQLKVEEQEMLMDMLRKDPRIRQYKGAVEMLGPYLGPAYIMREQSRDARQFKGMHVDETSKHWARRMYDKIGEAISEPFWEWYDNRDVDRIFNKRYPGKRTPTRGGRDADR